MIAVVNDDVISYYDLVQRVRLGLLAARLPDTQENRQRLAWQVLQGMVAEKLQLQEAKRLGITVRQGEIDETVGRIERGNNWPTGQFRQFMASNGIPFGTAHDQIRANLAWNKVVLRKLRPLVQVSPADVDEALVKLRQNVGKPEYRVAEIYLSVDKADQEGEVRRNAERIVQQIPPARRSPHWRSNSRKAPAPAAAAIWAGSNRAARSAARCRRDALAAARSLRPDPVLLGHPYPIFDREAHLPAERGRQ